MGKPDKPEYIRLVGRTFAETDFVTEKQKAAARAILEHWDDTDNFAEIARRSGWSSGHISNVFHEFFEPADETEIPPDFDTGPRPPEAASGRGVSALVEHAGDSELAELLIEMYALGYEHGQHDARVTNEDG